MSYLERYIMCVKDEHVIEVDIDREKGGVGRWMI
jgi:hypothetical protein